MKNIASAFVKAKKAFRPALKEKANPAFKGSKYADLSSCIEAVDDALLDNGIAMYQETFQDDTGVTVETVFLHESGESLRGGKLHVPAAKQDPQGYGSALSYARRYSLMAACGIAPEDDDGNAASKSHGATQKATVDSKSQKTTQASDTAATAQKIASEVKKGKTRESALWLSQQPEAHLNAIWVLLSESDQGAISAVWPVAQAA